MCEPTTIALGAMATAAAVGAYSSYKQAEAANKAADYNAKVAERNAEIAEEKEAKQIRDAKERYDSNREELFRKVKSTKGSQKSTLAASGVNLKSGSALDILGDTDWLGGQDALTLKRNYDMEVAGYEMEGEADKYNFLSQAKLLRMSKSDPWAAAGTSLLSGGSQMAAMYYGSKRG